MAKFICNSKKFKKIVISFYKFCKLSRIIYKSKITIKKAIFIYALEFLIKNKFNNYRYLENMFFAKSRCENAIIKHCIELMDGLKCNRKYQSLLRERKEIQNKLKDCKKKSDRNKYLARLADISRRLNDIRKDINLTKVGLQAWSNKTLRKIKALHVIFGAFYKKKYLKFLKKYAIIII